ncbi:MAG: hypothetical protein HOC33_11815 [Alphaproteobacteria bacterium]|nr:hypothetical protein [Alphaproteobacteria bacterium]MBT4544527.1 hypothetical protein [Alphaproteobacteria bacterium]
MQLARVFGRPTPGPKPTGKPGNPAPKPANDNRTHFERLRDEMGLPANRNRTPAEKNLERARKAKDLVDLINEIFGPKNEDDIDQIDTNSYWSSAAKGMGATGGSGGGYAKSTAEAQYNAAQGGPSDGFTGSQSFANTAENGWGATGGSGGGDAESQAEADYNAAQGGPSDPNGGSNSSASSSDSDYGDGQDWGGVDFGDWGFPVVLDLNNDGIQIIPLSHSTARFDIAGTGSRQVLAWPGPDEGIFVYDRDGDRLISHKDEIAFKDYLATAETDLEGLAWFDQLAQGGNEDGILDERDAAWGAFGVWRDLDQDGETDEGELQMTGEGGLKSLNLTSDHQAQDAGPDVKIFGKSTYEYLDANGDVQTGRSYDTALRHVDDTYPKRLGEKLYLAAGLTRHGFPPLVRRDGQDLHIGEMMYPEYDYNEDIHELWPNWAVRRIRQICTQRCARIPTLDEYNSGQRYRIY